MASNSASCCLSGSFCLRPLSKALIISLFIELGMMIEVIIADGQAMSGVGMLGMGGAIGPGKAANAGYHGRPGTMTLSCQSLKHLETPLATASRYLDMFPIIMAHGGNILM